MCRWQAYTLYDATSAASNRRCRRRDACIRLYRALRTHSAGLYLRVFEPKQRQPKKNRHSPGEKASECGGPQTSNTSYELLTLSPVLPHHHTTQNTFSKKPKKFKFGKINKIFNKQGINILQPYCSSNREHSKAKTSAPVFRLFLTTL